MNSDPQSQWRNLLGKIYFGFNFNLERVIKKSDHFFFSTNQDVFGI